MKSRVGRCPDCRMRRVLGRCRFKGGNIHLKDHCRQCCDAPEVLRWKPSLAAAVVRIAKSK